MSSRLNCKDTIEGIGLLVAAAGKGRRLGMGPKAFLRLGDKTLLRWVVEIAYESVDRVLVAVPGKYIDKANNELACFDNIEIIEGGSSRQATYRRLLDQCQASTVVIRDVARPLASSNLIKKVIDSANKHGAAGAFQPIHIPVAIKKGNYIYRSLCKNRVCLPSNPQAYQTRLLKHAMNQAERKRIQTQTLWELVLQENIKIYIVDGEQDNIKITNKRDWEIIQDVIFPRWLVTSFK